MKVHHSTKVTIVALALMTVCQVGVASRHETSAEFLKRHGIELTENSLVAALRNPDPEIRDNAAQEIANEKAVAASPAIKDALATEKDPERQVNFAYTLAQLGDKGGFVALKHFCDTASPSPGLKAASYMLRFGDESCLGAVQSVLRKEPQSDFDHFHMAVAMSLIPSFHKLTDSDKSELIALTVKRLGDSNSYTRMIASQVLAKIGDSSAIPPLEKAVADETDKVVRDSMEAELEKLQARGSH